MGTKWNDLLSLSIVPLNTGLISPDTGVVGALGKVKTESKTTTDDMGTKWNDLLSLSIVPLNAGLISPDTGIVGALGSVKDESKITTDDMLEEFDDVIGKIMDEGGLISAFKEEILQLDKIETAGGEAATATGKMWVDNEDNLDNLEDSLEDLEDALEKIKEQARKAGAAMGSMRMPSGWQGGAQDPNIVPGVIYPSGERFVPGMQHGADFIVPPGYSNDSYPMRVGTGEHVQVTPRGQLGGAGRGMTVNLYGNWNPETEQDAMRFTRMLAMLG